MNTTEKVRIRPARLSDRSQLAALFEGYRAFYRRAPSPVAVSRFLAERLKRRDSVIWVAVRAQTLVGFVQVYPIFSSLRMQRAWILNDLFVDVDARMHGVGRLLLRAVALAARRRKVACIELATEHTNRKAQRLYAAEGYQRERTFQHWSFSVDA